MKLIHFDLAGQKQTFEYYDLNDELEKVNSEIEKVWGKPVINPIIDLHQVKPRRYRIIDRE